MTPAFTRHGKQIFHGRRHVADAADEDAATLLTMLLNDRASVPPTRGEDQAKIDAITAMLALLVGLLVGIPMGASLL